MKINKELLLKGDRRSIAKAITLIESSKPDHFQEAQELLNELLPHSGNTQRIGITGVPGVGKSTFIEAFGLHLISLGKKVAVLAVDPSSPITGGSILGDKTRMEKLSQNEMAFIRPSPTSGSLGGVANKTRETITILEAAGYDTILIETVGVGQSEVEVSNMVDFFMVLMLPNAGDELQGIKKGILELADMLVINKVDGDSVNLANLTEAQYKNALTVINQTSFWQPIVMKCSAKEKVGINDIYERVQSYFKSSADNKELTNKRTDQNVKWLEHLVFDLLKSKLYQNNEVMKEWQKQKKGVCSHTNSPLNAALSIISKF